MKRKKITLDVPIPRSDLKTIAKTIQVEVEAKWSDEIGDYLLDGEASRKIERAKAVELGVLLPEQIRKLRRRLGMTCREMCELLWLEKGTWLHWENERKRPSLSTNVVLRALYDGELDVSYLKSLQSSGGSSPCP